MFRGGSWMLLRGNRPMPMLDREDSVTHLMVDERTMIKMDCDVNTMESATFIAWYALHIFDSRGSYKRVYILQHRSNVSIFQ